MSASAAFKLYMTDFCPFAQRSWITALEKESDPSHPKVFDYAEVNLWNRTDEVSSAFNKISQTVPAGIYNNDKPLTESLLINEFINDLFPQNPLLPSDAYGRFDARLLIERLNRFVGPFYAYLKDPSEKNRTDFESGLDKLEDELKKRGTPYFLGENFSLVDISVFPFLERMNVLLPHFHKWELPARFPLLQQYYARVSQRPSVKVTTSDRLPRSLARQPFSSTKREDYLRDIYITYANNITEEARPLLVAAKPGENPLTPQVIADLVAKKKAAAQGKL